MLNRSNAKSAAPAGQPVLRVVDAHDGEDLSQWGDEALMLEHGRGNEAAFECLVLRHQRSILNYIFRMVRNRHIAEELTQEVFIALVRSAARYQPTAKFTTYLYTIASNIVSKEWARQRRRPKFFSLSSFWWSEDGDLDPLDKMGDASMDVAAICHKGEIAEAVNEALMKLPEHQREAFVLHRFQELAYEEIAEILGTPVGTVKSRVVRAERALRPHLEAYREYL